MITQIKITGIILILLALMHIGFPKRFNWKNQLQSLDLLHKQMMEVHTFFVGLIVFLMGVLCLIAPFDLLNTPLGKKISLGIAFFWACRFVIQFLWYSPKLWQGKKFETAIHVLFSLLWLYFTLVFYMGYRY